MEVSSDSQIDTDLPDSPSDASVSNIASPADEVSALEQGLPTRLFADNQRQTDFFPSQTPVETQSKQRGNGRVYEISQDGKLKLKISLKGLRNPVEMVPAASPGTVEDNETQADSSYDNDDAETLVLGPEGKDDTQETTRIVSQDAVPTAVGGADDTSQSLVGALVPQEEPLHGQSIAQGLGSSRKEQLDDTFSDDISFSEIEKGVVDRNTPGQFVEVSPSVQVLEAPGSYSVRLKLSTTLIERLKKDKLTPVSKKATTGKVSKRLQAKAKAVKPVRPKMKKRPKPQYSRFMVKMPQPPPAVLDHDRAQAQAQPMDLVSLIKMQLANQTNTAAGPVPALASAEDDDDEDIVEKYMRLSLKDPLSGLRMVTPLRSKYCSHVECFDYESFLAMYNLRPFRIAIQRYSDKPARVGEVDVMKILEDTNRRVIDVKDHNKMTQSFPYKTKQKMFKEKSKQMNDLEWFCCPICKLEFNIKRIGDVYVVGEFVDMLQDLSLEDNNENVEDIEIDMSEKGKWRWIREDENDEMLRHRNGATHENSITPQSGGVGDISEENAEGRSQDANTNSHKETRHNVEVVTLDSDEEDNAGDYAEAENGQVAGATASETMMHTLGPLIQANNPETTEEEMMKEIDALFEAEFMNEDDTSSTTPAVPTKNTSPINAPEVVPVFTPPPIPASVSSATAPTPAPTPTPTSTPAHVHFGGNTGSLFQKTVESYRPYSTSINSINNHGGAFIKDPNPHRGVVVFRPGAFTTQNYESPAAPVFMSGEGAADDPIVLD